MGGVSLGRMVVKMNFGIKIKIEEHHLVVVLLGVEGHDSWTISEDRVSLADIDQAIFDSRLNAKIKAERMAARINAKTKAETKTETKTPAKPKRKKKDTL